MTKRIEILVQNESSLGKKGKEKRQVKADVREAGKAVLAALETWGILGQGQIEGLVFGKEMAAKERVHLFFYGSLKDRHDRSSYRVLKRLSAAGLVRLNYYLNASLYTLTKRGHAYLCQQRLARLPGFRESMSPALIDHEILTSGVGLVVNELLGLPVSTEFERYVRSRHAKNGATLRRLKLPDLWITDDRQPKAIEIERTLKEAHRYRELWAAYRTGLPPQAVVLYITAWPNGAKAILSRARDLLMDFIYVCDLTDFEKSLGQCPFIGYRGTEIRLEKRPCHPQGTQPRLVPFAQPSQPPAAMLIRPASGPDQFVAPPALRPFPRPQPRTPSPSPEGADSYRWAASQRPSEAALPRLMARSAAPGLSHGGIR